MTINVSESFVQKHVDKINLKESCLLIPFHIILMHIKIFGAMKKGDTILFERTKCFITEVLATSEGEDIVWLDYEDPTSGQQQAVSMELAERTCTRKVLIEKTEMVFEYAHLMMRLDNRNGVQEHDFYVDGQKYIF